MATNVWGCDYRYCVSERAFDKVPYLKYNEHKNKNYLVRAGWSINSGNTFGVKYEQPHCYSRLCRLFRSSRSFGRLARIHKEADAQVARRTTRNVALAS